MVRRPTCNIEDRKGQVIKFMISTKLNRHAVAGNLMLELNDEQLNPVIEKFYLSCKDEGVLIRRSSAVQPIQINFYLVQLEEHSEIANIQLKSVPRDFTFVITIFYVSSQDDEKRLAHKTPVQRTLLVRQGLDSKFYADYEFENTQSEQETLRFLCQMSATIINSKFEKQIDFYDQTTSGVRAQAENEKIRVWINILYQIPGLGQEKCQAVAQRFPSYQSLLSDYLGARELGDLGVRRGLKEVRLGETLANRIYKALFSLNWEQSIMQRR